MTENLPQAVESTRVALERDPDSYMFAEFPPGAPGDGGEASMLPTGLCDLLELTDGHHAGELAFYSTTNIAQAQHYCEGIDVLGEGYLRLTDSDESDPWYRFLRDQGLVS